MRHAGLKSTSEARRKGCARGVDGVAETNLLARVPQEGQRTRTGLVDTVEWRKRAGGR